MRSYNLSQIREWLDSSAFFEHDKEELEDIRETIGRRLADIEDEMDSADRGYHNAEPVNPGDVWTIGLGYSEKIRDYAVIAVPNDARNLAIVVPSTTVIRGSAFEIQRSKSSKKSVWNVPGLLSLDVSKIRSGKKVGTVGLEELLQILQAIDAALKLSEQFESIPKLMEAAARKANKPKSIFAYIKEEEHQIE
ncbi:MAG: hypothetical protein U1F81_03150 [Verrucomicrobiaceae bacterium]